MRELLGLGNIAVLGAANLGMGVGVLSRAMLAYWSANNASASAGLINSIAGSKGRNLAKTSDPTRPTLASGRIVFTAASVTRLIEGGALQTLTLVASPVVTLPDGTGSDAGKGLTPTGGVTAPDGTRWVMNFGKPTEASPTNLPSLVQLSADFTTKLAEIPFSSIASGPVGGTQGLAYDPTDDSLVFWVNNKVWFISLAGVVRRTIDFTAVAINGICYDPSTDGFVIVAAADNSTVYWMDRTGALGRSIPIYGTAIDHLCLANGYLWYSGQGNGSFLGGAIRQVDLSNGRVIGQWFTDSGAPEGLFVNGSEVWLLDDGYHHATNAVNTARKYVLDPLPNVYPGAGRRVLFGGVAKLDTAIASSVALFSLGQPVTANDQGIGLFFPSGSTTSLRVQVNNNSATWTVSATTTEFLFVLDMDYGAGTASLYINGVLISTLAVTGLAATAIAPTMQVMIGAAREGATVTRTPNGKMANLMIITDAIARQAMEGEVAWDAGTTALLPSDHPYKSARPSLN